MSFEREAELARDAHQKAFQSVKDQFMPDINVLIQQGVDLLAGKITLEELEEEYGPQVKAAAQAYVSHFTSDFLQQEINSRLKDSGSEEADQLAEDGLGEKLTDAAMGAAALVLAYFKKQIDPVQLMHGLGSCGVKEVLATLLKAKGIDIQAIQAFSGQVMTASSAAVAFAALTEAYKILSNTLAEAALQHEEMLRVKAQCDASAALICEYRMEMNERISSWFGARYDVIEKGFSVMDQAILKGDSDGYLSANAEIQKMLGYHAQFSTQAEFDDLMDSDLDFKL